jgi:hypothetical protein
MVPKHLKRFKETRNQCYNLTIGEKDLADLAFAGLFSYMKERMEGKEFIDVNQVLQRDVVHENRAKYHSSYGRFKENGSKEMKKHNVNYIDEESTSDNEVEVCVAEWVDTPKDKPISCSFLKPIVSKRDEMKVTFDVPK